MIHLSCWRCLSSCGSEYMLHQTSPWHLVPVICTKPHRYTSIPSSLTLTILYSSSLTLPLGLNELDKADNYIPGLPVEGLEAPVQREMPDTREESSPKQQTVEEWQEVTLFLIFFSSFCRECIALGTVHVLSLTLCNLLATNISYLDSCPAAVVV